MTKILEVLVQGVLANSMKEREMEEAMSLFHARRSCLNC